MQSANKIGKTYAVCAEDAIDLTGRYPPWWEGYKYDHPVKLVCGGINNDKTRDLLQAALCGDPALKSETLGTGWIPKECIGKVSLKRGVTDAFIHVKVKHSTEGKFDGWSNLTFQSYESGKEAWMGDDIHIFHLDEEPPKDILDQALRGCIASGGHIRLSYTPENGKTDVVIRVEKEWSMHKAGWKHVTSDDFDIEVIDKDGKKKVLKFKKNVTLSGKPGHMTEEKTRLACKSFPAYQLPMRSEGEPVLGSGQVYTYSEDQIKIPPMDELPAKWPRGAALDFGGTSDEAHPTAFVMGAHDPVNDVLYIYNGFRTYGSEIADVAARIISRPDMGWMPVFWPHDGGKGGNINDPAGGTVADKYRQFGINMFHTHFTNPDDEKPEHRGGIAIEPGIIEISGRIADRRIRVFSTFTEWFDEYRNYHQKDGKIVPRDDDIMAATRYLTQMIRFFEVEPEDEEYNYNYTSGKRDSVTGY